MSTLGAISWNAGEVEHSEVFAIGFTNIVYVNRDSTDWVSLGFHAKQVSAGLTAGGTPEVFAIGEDNSVYRNDFGMHWVDLGGDFTAISATVDNTVFAIGKGHILYVNHGSGFVALGGYVKALSTGLDTAGKPEVYVIGHNDAVFVDDDGKGWTKLGGNVSAISATGNGTVFAIGENNIVYVDRGSGFLPMGGDASEISGGLDAAGNPEVYAIGRNSALYVNDNGNRWVDLGGYVTELSATAGGMLFARGEDLNSIEVHSGGNGLISLGAIPLANPTAAIDYLPAPAGTSLFLASDNNEPSYLDVSQGDIGDCWLLASLAAVAARDPQDIINMFTYNGTTLDNGVTVGLYTARLYQPNGSAFEVDVNTELPAGGAYYDYVLNGLGTEVLWVALAEKAYAEANSLGFVTTSNEYDGSYSALNGGLPSWALEAITGNPASDVVINPTKMAAAWSAGDLIVLATDRPHSRHIISDHAYAVVGYNAASSKPVELYNPWGAGASGLVPGYNQFYGLFTTRTKFVGRNFVAQSMGSGAESAGKKG